MGETLVLPHLRGDKGDRATGVAEQGASSWLWYPAHSRVTCQHVFSAQPCTFPRVGRELLQNTNQTCPSLDKNLLQAEASPQFPAWPH
jgi:hypothetical protein